jgi:hypothetical protein
VRPAAIFGSASHPGSDLPVPVTDASGQLITPTNLNVVEKGTQVERLIAVGCIFTSILQKFKLKYFQGLL